MKSGCTLRKPCGTPYRWGSTSPPLMVPCYGVGPCPVSWGRRRTTSRSVSLYCGGFCRPRPILTVRTLQEEMRRNTFWLAYCYERWQAASTGWAMALDDEDISQVLSCRMSDFENGVRRVVLSILLLAYMVLTFNRDPDQGLYRLAPEDFDSADVDPAYARTHRLVRTIRQRHHFILQSQELQQPFQEQVLLCCREHKCEWGTVHRWTRTFQAIEFSRSAPASERAVARHLSDCPPHRGWDTGGRSIARYYDKVTHILVELPSNRSGQPSAWAARNVLQPCYAGTGKDRPSGYTKLPRRGQPH